MGEAGMIRRIAFVVSLGAVAVAVSGPSTADPATTPPGNQATPTPASVLPLPATEPQCDAAALTYLIGKLRTEIPVPVEPARRRVYCSSCIITEDYVPDRTDIVFDSQTGIITEVKCG